MSSLGESSASIEAVLDVGMIVPACFENPLKDQSVTLLADAISIRRRLAIPVTATMGAYHIATRYLGAPRLAVKKILVGLLSTKSPALYRDVSPELAADGLDFASTYDVESWDGYLIAVSRSLGTRIIYSLDETLSMVGEITVVNPFPKDAVRRYHDHIRALTSSM